MGNFEKIEQVDVPLDLEGKGVGAGHPWSAEQALEEFDARWYTRVSRLGRWMDIIGDFAGDELFLLNGDSLLSVVLDDPLLALGKDTDVSFQYLHARYSLERALEEYVKRNAVFEVVFFEYQKHSTYQTGSSKFVVTSRCLARSLLKSSLQELSIPVHTFNDLDDPEWHNYIDHRKPMFIMTDDGGSVLGDLRLQAERALIQRVSVYGFLTNGLAVALMRGSQFKDAKIFSYLYEQRRVSDARKELDSRIWDARDSAVNMLNMNLAPSVIRTTALDRTDWLSKASSAFLDSVGPYDTLARPLLYVFLSHGLILESIPLSLRAQPFPDLSPEIEGYLRKEFFPLLFECLERSLPSRPTFRDIDLDARVFLHLLQTVPPGLATNQAMTSMIDPTVTTELARLWKGLDKDTGFTLPLSSVKSMVQRGASDHNVFNVLPFSHPILNEHLAMIQVDTVSSPSDPEPGQFDPESGLSTMFKDTMHWHNHKKAILPKHLGGEDVISGPATPASIARARRRALRRDQWFQASLERHAQSLTGAFGKKIETIVIPSGKAKATEVIASKKQRTINAPVSQKKKTKMTTTEKIRLQVQIEKQAKGDASDMHWWVGKDGKGGKLRELQRLGSLDAQIQETDLLLRNQRTARGRLTVEVPLYRLNLELRAWINHPTPEAPSVQDRFRTRILKMIKEQSTPATPTVIRMLSSVLSALGFSDMTGSLLGDGNQPDCDLTFEFVKILKKSGSLVHRFMKLHEHPVHWLLRCFGEYMDRSLDSMPDSRVQFDPDHWQREVLDSLDEDASVLVVAPTSAGKTFISFYAMERVLRSSDDGVLVYVAPTKALVTQIAAEVSKRFKKDVNGRSFWAIHTRDYRIHDSQKCQVLITVPEVLAIMLLSPPLARVWTPRLRRIILDEIHSIGQEEGGSVWEQVLLLAPCPVIGLSATVGAPERFNAWLESVQNAHFFKHVFIQHKHRYSHLRKYIYLRSVTQAPFTGLSQYKPTGRLRFVHPVCTLSAGMARTLPPDFTLEASDCLTLYDELRKLADSDNSTGIIQAYITRMDPARFFDPTQFLKQKDILRYEQALTEVLSILIKSPNSHDVTSELQTIVRGLTDPEIARTREDLLLVAPEREELQDSLVTLLSDLHAQSDLPALVFSFDRHQCETQAQRIISCLEEAEQHWRTTSPEWQRKLKAWEQYQAKAKERDRAKERAHRQKKLENEEAPSSEDTAWEAHFDPAEPCPEFSFAGVKTTYDKTSLDKDLDDLSWTTTPRWAIDAIRRGVAVHHSGMNKRYRSLVEALFRVGFLRIVIATGTLALGINAPCKTVVFSGDSAFLTALQYRQAAGRAGRRGFDLLGKVVFHGISLDRVQRLVLSRIPPISGQFPMSITLCLRLFNLLSGSQNAEYATTAVKAILSLPQISLGSETGQHQLLHHLRFNIDYLRRAYLLSSDGHPLNLAGIVTHLYYHEPNNLAFVALLRRGIIHDICNQASTDRAAHDLMLVLCYLFGRRRLPLSTIDPKTMRSPSSIVLPRLPDAVTNELENHDRLILDIFKGYAWSYTSQNTQKLGPDDTLPLSRIKVTSSSPSVESEFCRRLHSSASINVVRSAFVATSGHTDSFASVGELCHESRKGLHLNEHAVPSMDDILAYSKLESPYRLNAYLLDFYMHGQVNALVNANGIRRGDIWYLLQDFVLTLLVIRTSLQELLVKVSESKQDSSTPTRDEDSVSLDLDLDEQESMEDGDAFSRLPGVDDADWKVYEVFSKLGQEFEAKFHKMWA